jgi:predicted Fe-Mo cluster-binding NifX family protein
MKIAAISDDGITISQHFGRAPYYVVFNIEDGKIISHEKREKLGHSHFAGESQPENIHHDHSQGHGFDPAAQNRHAQMAEAISDCEVLLAGGMGNGAYVSLKAANIKPIITDILNIEEAIKKFIDGTIVDHQEKLH